MHKLKSLLFAVHSYVPFYLVIILVLCDLLLRNKIIFSYNFIEWLMYINSILFINEFLKVLLKMSFKKLNKIKYFTFTITLTAVATIILLSIISYGCYFYFGLLPNKGIISYVVNEPLSSWVLVKDYLKLWYILLSVIGIGAFLFLILKNSKYVKLGKKNIFVNAGISFFALASLVHTAQRFDQCGLPASQTITSSIDYFLINSDQNKTRTLTKTGSMKVLMAEKAADFNILLIINESVRRTALQIYNDTLKTSPSISAFKKNYKDNFFQFEWARTNASLTFLSVPSILNGLSPYADKNLWLAAPLLWDYAKAASLETFFISSHCFNWGGWKNYLLQGDKLDYYYTECEFTGIGRNERNHPLGIEDDSIFIERLLNHIDSLNNMSKNFCGILHLYGTHAPYWCKAENRKIKGNSREIDYYNSIYQQDQSLSVLFKYLEDKKLVDNTVIIYTSDHGEAFGKRDVSGHLTRYFEEVVGIPLWIYIPEKLSQHYDKFTIKNNLQRNISNIDILPTILDLLKVPINSELYKKDGGISLLQEIPKDREILITNYNNINYARFDKSYCLITDSLKYIYRTHNEKLDISIYNFIADKDETNNLNKNNRNVVEVNYELLKNL